MTKNKANFLWPAEEGSAEFHGYEFANGNTEEYRQMHWNCLVEELEKRGADKAEARVKNLERIFDAERQARADDRGKYLQDKEILVKRLRELEAENKRIKTSQSEALSTSFRREINELRDENERLESEVGDLRTAKTATAELSKLSLSIRDIYCALNDFSFYQEKLKEMNFALAEAVEKCTTLEAENERLNSKADSWRDNLVIQGKRADAAEARLEEAEGVVSFYADPESYFAVLIMGDRPCGDFADDIDDNHSRPDMGPRPGKLAREYIRKHYTPAKEGDSDG